MVKTVVDFKNYQPPVPEVISPKGDLTVGIIIRQVCCELWNTKSEPFYSAVRSFDKSVSPSGVVWYDKATVVDQIIGHIRNTDRDHGLEFPVSTVHARFVDWARANEISRKQLKAKAKAIMIEAAKAAE